MATKRSRNLDAVPQRDNDRKEDTGAPNACARAPQQCHKQSNAQSAVTPPALSTKGLTRRLAKPQRPALGVIEAVRHASEHQGSDVALALAADTAQEDRTAAAAAAGATTLGAGSFTAAAHRCSSGLRAGVESNLKRRWFGAHAQADRDCALRDQAPPAPPASPTASCAIVTLLPTYRRCNEPLESALGPTQMGRSSPEHQPGSSYPAALLPYHQPAPESHQRRTPAAPYRAFTSLLRAEIKLQGVEPEDISPGFLQRISHVVSGAGACGLAHVQGGHQAPGARAGEKHAQLEAVYVRRGCVELVVDVRVWAGGEGEAARNGERGGEQEGAGRADEAGQAAAVQAAEGACTTITAPGAGPAGGGSRIAEFLCGSAAPLQQQQQEHACPLALQQRWQHRSFPSCTASLTPLTASPSASEGGGLGRATCGGMSSGSSCRSAIDVGLLIRALQLPHEATVDYAHLYPLSGAGVLAPAAGWLQSPRMAPTIGGAPEGRGAAASGVEEEGQVVVEAEVERQWIAAELNRAAAIRLRPEQGGGGGMGPQGLGAERGGRADRTGEGPEAPQAPPPLVGARPGAQQEWQQQQQQGQGLLHGESEAEAGALLHVAQPDPPPAAPAPSAPQGWHSGAVAATSAAAATAAAAASASATAASAAAAVAAGGVREVEAAVAAAGVGGTAGLALAWRFVGPRVLALPLHERQLVVMPPPVAGPAAAVWAAAGASTAAGEPQQVRTAPEPLYGGVFHSGENTPRPAARRSSYSPGLMLPHGRPPLPMLQQQQQQQQPPALPPVVGQEDRPQCLPVVAQLKAEVELGALVAGPADSGWVGAGLGFGLWSGTGAGLEVVVRSQGRCLPVSVVWHDDDGQEEEETADPARAGLQGDGAPGQGHERGSLRVVVGCSDGGFEDEGSPSADVGASWSSVDSAGALVVPDPAFATAVALGGHGALAYPSGAATGARGLRPPQLLPSHPDQRPRPAQHLDPVLATTASAQGPDLQLSPQHVHQLLASTPTGAVAAAAAVHAAATTAAGGDSPADSRAQRDTGSATPATTSPQPSSLHTYRRRCTILLHALPPFPGLLLVEIAPTRTAPGSHPSDSTPVVTNPHPATPTTPPPPPSANPPHPYASAYPPPLTIPEAAPGASSSPSVSAAAAAAAAAESAAGALGSSLPALSRAYVASSPRDGPASVAPVLLLADPRVAAELQALCDTWQGGEGQLRDMVLDLGCFVHHAHRLLAAGAAAVSPLTLAASAAPAPATATATQVLSLPESAASTHSLTPPHVQPHVQPHVPSHVPPQAVPFDHVPAAVVLLRVRLLDLGTHLVRWFAMAAPEWPNTLGFLQLTLAQLGTRGMLEEPEQEGMRGHAAAAARAEGLMLEEDAGPWAGPEVAGAGFGVGRSTGEVELGWADGGVRVSGVGEVVVAGVGAERQQQQQQEEEQEEDPEVAGAGVAAGGDELDADCGLAFGTHPEGKQQQHYKQQQPHEYNQQQQLEQGDGSCRQGKLGEGLGAKAGARSGGKAVAKGSARAAWGTGVRAAGWLWREWHALQAAVQDPGYDAFASGFMASQTHKLMLLLLSLYVALVARVWAGWTPANHLPPPTPASAHYPSTSTTSTSTSPLSPTTLMALALDLAPSLVATAPMAILAVAWPLSSRPTWQRLVRHSMGWRLAAHLAAGAMVGWGGWAPSPGVNGYHLGPGVVVGDGVIYLGTATVSPRTAAVLALLRVPVYVAMWRTMGAAFSPAYAWVRSAFVCGLAVVVNACCHALLWAAYRRHCGRLGGRLGGGGVQLMAGSPGVGEGVGKGGVPGCSVVV